MAFTSEGFLVKVGDYDIFADEAHKLGNGVLGTVYSGRNRFDHKINVAAKKVTVETEFLDLQEHLKEIELLLHTIPHHENIIKVHEFTTIAYVEDGIPMTDIWMVMDKGELGNLKKYARREKLSLAKKVDIIFQCVLAVHHLHNCSPESITHRDIKPENVVLTTCKDRVVVKLVDFGYARTVQRVSGRSVTMESMAGTRSYQAPEQIHPKKGHFPHDKSVDIFSLALTILALLDSAQGVTMEAFVLDDQSLGYAMWRMANQHGAAWSGFVPNIDRSDDGPVTKAIKKILKTMLQTQPSDRIGINEVLEKLSAVRREFPEANITSIDCTPAHTVPEMHPAEAAMRHLDVSGSSSASETKETSGAKPKHRTSSSVKSKEDKSAKPQSQTSRSVKSKAPQSTKPKLLSAIFRKFAGAQETKKTRGAKPKHPTSGSVNEDKSTNPIRPSGNVSKNAGAQGRRSGAIEVQEIAHHKLDFEGEWMAGPGCHGEILLADKNRCRPGFVTFKYEGNKYTASMERDLPDGVRYDYYKSMNSSGELFFQQYSDTETLCCSSDGKVITTLQHKGKLLDSVGDLLMYGCGTLYDLDWSVQVHEYKERGAYHSGRAASEQEASQPVLTLKPPAPYGWSSILSVSRVYDDRYVVVDRYTNSLDTFNGNGEYMKHTVLTYQPAVFHAVTAWSGYIVVAEQQPPALHIYTDSGEHITSKTHKQLGLDEDEYVQGIRCDSNGVLHVCVGGLYTITSLHAFQIKKC